MAKFFKADDNKSIFFPPKNFPKLEKKIVFSIFLLISNIIEKQYTTT